MADGKALKTFGATASGLTFTVEIVNKLARSRHFVGTFATKEEAEAYAKQEASRTRKFAEYTVYTGTPNKHYKQVSGPFVGVH